MQEQVEENLHGRSAQIRELAILAATLQDLVHSEVIENLAHAFSVHGELTEEDADFSHRHT